MDQTEKETTILVFIVECLEQIQSENLNTYFSLKQLVLDLSEMEKDICFTEKENTESSLNAIKAPVKNNLLLTIKKISKKIKKLENNLIGVNVLISRIKTVISQHEIITDDKL